MTTDLGSLSIAAITIGFVHCVGGPDHYIPFVAMSRVGLWSLRKTILITLLCGIGHVAGSALIGFIGIALGLIVFQLDGLTAAEIARGELAAWMLSGFGLVYCVWGILHAIRRRKAARGPSDSDPLEEAQARTTEMTSRAGSFTPWILFAIFVFGPCEPLIPMLMVPASEASIWGVVWVTALFGLTTLVTMTTLVALIHLGLFAGRLGRVEIYGHAAAGLIVAACGLAIVFDEQIRSFAADLLA